MRRTQSFYNDMAGGRVMIMARQCNAIETVITHIFTLVENAAQCHAH